MYVHTYTIHVHIASACAVAHNARYPHTHTHPGLYSILMRDMANLTHDNPKWIVLDGDIDPMWIESLNTVMDDNKVRRLRCDLVSCSPSCGMYIASLTPKTSQWLNLQTPPHPIVPQTLIHC